jgi:uncharacterized phage-associated protein
MKIPSPPEWTHIAGYDEEKSAQVVAYFACKSKKPIGKMKLIKLVYLSEREFLSRHSMPMTFDEFYSMKDGPVASAALNGINGNLRNKIWSEWIKLKGRFVFAAKAIKSRLEFDHLSDADLEVLKAIWDKFGGLTDAEIWKFVHDKKNIPEYTPLENGRLAIRYDDMLRALGKDNANEIAEEIQVMQREAALL